MDLYGVYVGDRLGLYRALADSGPLTSSGLAEAAGIHERYAREWLEQQAATGILEVDDVEAAADRAALRPARRPTKRSFSTRRASTTRAPFGKLIVAVDEADRGAARSIPDRRRGSRTKHYGQDLVRGSGGVHAADVHAPAGQRLAAGGSGRSRAATGRAACAGRRRRVRCGWSSIAIARAYPQVHVDGIDLDTASISEGRREPRRQRRRVTVSRSTSVTPPTRRSPDSTTS